MLKPIASSVFTGVEGLAFCCKKGGLRSRVATDEWEENLSGMDFVEESDCVLFSQGKNNTA